MLDKAGRLCRKILQKRPKHAQALHLLGLMAHQQNDPQAAIDWHLKAVAAKPDFAQAYNSLGAALAACDKLDEAVVAFRRAVALQPDYPRACGNLGILLKDCGRVRESIDAFRSALAARNSWHEARGAILLASHYLSETDPISLLAEHRFWDRVHAGHLAGNIAPHTNGREADRPLRIGLVSADFKEHPVIRFIMPLLEHHNRKEIELFIYENVSLPDQWTELARKHADSWRSLTNMPDDEAAALIRGDEIDILVDLSGHTLGSRLLLFARKPAPIQVTYLGYPGTTGLAAMDYRITDALADPPGMTEDHHSERLIRLPHSAWCYFADTKNLPVQSPAISRGYVTFGSFNNLAKLNDRMLAVWARILAAVPDSKLILKSAGLRSMEARKWVTNTLGIDPERLDLRGALDSHEAHLGLYGEMDIALDTFPYHGTTTTCEALWMGLPVITLAGNTHVSRVGISLLNNAGFPELVAHSEDEYVRLAVELSQDVAKLADTRLKRREILMNSQLLDAPSFAHEMEALFRQIWTTWINSTTD